MKSAAVLVACAYSASTWIAQTNHPPISAQPLKLNECSSAMLKLIPGVGPSMADKLLRLQHLELEEIPGVGPRTRERLEAYLIHATRGQASGQP